MENKLRAALEITGIEKCQFGPDSDPCDNCGAKYVQLYFLPGPPGYYNDGDYLCEQCTLDFAEEFRPKNSMISPTGAGE